MEPLDFEILKETPDYVELHVGLKNRLKEIADAYKIPIKDLVAFHNLYAKSSERVHPTLTGYVDVIYLPFRYYKKRQQETLKKSTLELPKASYSAIYGVILSLPEKKKQLHYTIQVQGKDNQILLRKEKTFINEREVTRVIEQLLEKASKTLYPLILNLTSQGTIAGIANVETIQNRWYDEVRPSLTNYYQSEVGDSILRKLDMSFDQLEKRSLMLEKDLCYKLFFLPVYKEHFQYKSELSTAFFSSGSQTFHTFDLQMILHREYTRSNKILLEVKGQEQENFFNTKAKGDFSATYKFLKDTHILFSINAHLTLFENDVPMTTEIEVYKM